MGTSIDPTWIEAFPFINNIENSDLQSLNNFNVPQLGQVTLNYPLFLNHLSSKSSFKVIRKERIKGFLADEPIPLVSIPSIPAKLQINVESDGILFESQSCDNSTALMFLDITEKSLSFIEAGTCD